MKGCSLLVLLQYLLGLCQAYGYQQCVYSYGSWWCTHRHSVYWGTVSFGVLILLIAICYCIYCCVYAGRAAAVDQQVVYYQEPQPMPVMMPAGQHMMHY